MMRRRLIVLLAGAAVSQRIDRARDYPTTPVTCEDRTRCGCGMRERGRGDRDVPVLRRGPVAGGLFQRRAIAVARGLLQRRAIAVAGGLLERRGDRARAVEEVGVSNNSKLKTGPAGGGAYLCESFSSP